MNKNKTLLLAFAVILLFFTVPFLLVSHPKQVNDEMRVEEILRITEELPHSPLKNNLLSVIAAEYGGNSHQLYTLMKEFNKIQIEKLNKNETRNLH